MTITLPYPLSFLTDVLRAMSGRMDIQRRDEMSGIGDGRVWSAELAAPIWTGSYAMTAARPPDARAIDAKFRALGVNRPLLFADPGYDGPAGDPGGVIVGSNVVTLTLISTDRTAIRLGGLPSGYALAPGDRLSVAWGTDRYWLAETVEPAVASGLGETPTFSVHPYVPAGISAGATVEIVRPICKMIVRPGGYTAFESLPGYIASGARVDMVQKV